jgi:PIN domain nuclease of toxin-antitoxin system
VSAYAILLDTCAALWIGDKETLTAQAEAALAAADRGAILVSPITAWEIGLLASRGRIALSRPAHIWFDDLVASGVGLAKMPPKILIDSSFLPGAPLRDPADRIIAATARAFGYRLMTRDRALLDLGDAGHLKVIAC